MWNLFQRLWEKGKGRTCRNRKNCSVDVYNHRKRRCFLLKTPEDTYYMCDTGKKEDYQQIKKVLEKKQVTELKGIFLSHGHKDHAGNVKNLIKDYPIEKIYLSKRDDASYEKVDMQELAGLLSGSIGISGRWRSIGFGRRDS